MTDMLQEFCDSRGMALRVDRSGGVIRGIKILGLRSRNNREYLPEALARAVSLYEGAKVNVNHPKGHPLAPRDYQERIGVIRSVQHRSGEGLFADFHFNPKHYLSEQLIWDAEHAPENVGFSHNVQARTSRRGETVCVDEITRVHSVDLVADPATTRGLFESSQTQSGAAAASEMAGFETSDSRIASNLPNPAAIDSHVVETAAAGPQQTTLEATCRQQRDEIAELRTEIDQLRTQAALHQRRVLIQSLLAEYKLPQSGSSDPAAQALVSETFMQSLLAAPNEQAARHLLKERVRLIESAAQFNATTGKASRPICREQSVADPRIALNGESFARAIRR